ncbi:MAG TPA: PEP-CTERM sorting domain-containing protein [Pyrinomonadaceae bacterium]|nr:PEP-CTERM sorting domain-containing protein [Pyrinomonadaceae bacterium]
MTNRILAMVKPLALSVFAVAFFTLAQGVARADEVTLTGTTSGTVTGVPQLTFVGNAFTGSTELGVGSLSGANRLGTFTLGLSNPSQLVAGSFTLDITFTAPAGINGGQLTSYTATVTGSVAPAPNEGGVFITFNQPAGGTVFTFSDGTTTGSFTLTLANLFVQSGQTANLTAGFTGSQSTVPEPATMILLGTGISGVAAVVRRRRKTAK